MLKNKMNNNLKPGTLCQVQRVLYLPSNNSGKVRKIMPGDIVFYLAEVEDRCRKKYKLIYKDLVFYAHESLDNFKILEEKE